LTLSQLNESFFKRVISRFVVTSRRRNISILPAHLLCTQTPGKTWTSNTTADSCGPRYHSRVQCTRARINMVKSKSLFVTVFSLWCRTPLDSWCCYGNGHFCFQCRCCTL